MSLFMRKPIEVSEKVWLVGGQGVSHPLDCRVYAVQGHEGIVLVDCGSAHGVVRVIENVGKAFGAGARVVTVIGTHCHSDHLGGAAELKRRLPDVKLAVHEADTGVVEAGDSTLSCADWMFGDEIEPVAVDIVLHEGETLEAGGLAFEIHHLPGHCAGAIAAVVNVAGRRVAFLGDSYSPSCDTVGYDLELLRESCRRIMEFEADTVCPGHSGLIDIMPVEAVYRGGMAGMFARAVIDNRALGDICAAGASFMYANAGMFKPVFELSKKFL